MSYENHLQMSDFHEDTSVEYEEANQHSQSAAAGETNLSKVRDRLVFVLENVYVHPTSNERDQIAGKLSIAECEETRQVYLIWEPYSLEKTKYALSFQPDEDWENCCYQSEEDFVFTPNLSNTTENPPENPRKSADFSRKFSHCTAENGKASRGYSNPEAYATRIPLSAILSFRKVVPPIGWTNLIFQLRDGVTLPPLYLHAGGKNLIKEFLTYLEEYVMISEEPGDPDRFLVNDSDNLLQQSLQSLHLAGPSSQDAKEENIIYERVKEASWNILEGFSKVTRAAKATAKSSPFMKLFHPADSAQQDASFAYRPEAAASAAGVIDDVRPGAVYMSVIMAE
eukprot:Sdes_comp9658_c0_seq2m1158